MLLEIQKVIPIKLHIVHVNHLIRDDAADDAAYVEQLCKKYSLPFTLVEKDVAAIAEKKHISTEEAGRNVRYEAFYKALGGHQGKIAIAHNKNDCCETFLFHLFRGSSLRGLSGIRPVRDKIVRPMMCLERAQIEAFLAQREIKFCIDSTNLEDNYTRNRIRHHILETAEKEISAAAVTHISDACTKIGEAYDLITDMTAKGYADCVTCTAGNAWHLEAASFQALHETLQGYVIMEILARAAGSRRDLEAVHVEQVQALLKKQTGRQIHLPYQLVAVREYEGICIKKNEECEKQAAGQEIVLAAAERRRLLRGETLEFSLQGRGIIEFSLVTADNLQNIPEKKYTKWFDYDKIEKNVVIRTRKTGDYLTINSMNQHKTLKAYLVDAKVPRQERSRLCLVAEESHILWIVGGRISNYYKVSRDTETILQISCRERKL